MFSIGTKTSTRSGSMPRASDEMFCIAFSHRAPNPYHPIIDPELVLAQRRSKCGGPAAPSKESSTCFFLQDLGVWFG